MPVGFIPRRDWMLNKDYFVVGDLREAFGRLLGQVREIPPYLKESYERAFEAFKIACEQGHVKTEVFGLPRHQGWEQTPVPESVMATYKGLEAVVGIILRTAERTARK